MAWRLRLVPEKTNIDFFAAQKYTVGISVVAMVASVIFMMMFGLNYGIDFRGGTTIRTDAEQAINIPAYRSVIEPLGFGEVGITEVFDPTFGPNQHVAQIRLASEGETASVSPETLNEVEAALKTVDPTLRFASVESVGPKVSGELINTAIYSILASMLAIVIYIWMRFEWQFAVGALLGLVHDVLVTVGVFALFQIKFDLTTIAALLTIVGYSINDTVVVFDRLRENLVKYRDRKLRDLMNLSVNETLSRTLMTSGTTLVALIALLVLGGDVIRGFVFAIAFGIVIGTYSSVYISKNVVLWLGVKRGWGKPEEKADPAETPFSEVP